MHALPVVALGIRAVPHRRLRLALADLTARTLDPKGRVTARMRAGFRIHLDLSDRFQAQMYLLHTYEPAVTRLIGQLLLPGDTFVDGGANIGYFTLLGAVLVGTTGAVHAFEPVGPTIAALDANIALNGLTNVVRHQTALADSAAPLVLEIPRDRRTGAAAYWGATAVRMQRGAHLGVAACTLDDYAKRALLTRIKLVKLDLEGGEAAALRGMARLLAGRAISYLLCECNQFLLASAGRTFEALRRELAGFGYRCFRIDEAGVPHLLDRAINPADHSVTDYLFVASDVALAWEVSQ